MPNWQGSSRRMRLPADWPKRRAHVLKRDGHQCTHTNPDGIRCDQTAHDVDHIAPGDNHEYTNLRALCSMHHNTKSGQEGAAALAAKRRAADKRFRRNEQHPGLL